MIARIATVCLLGTLLAGTAPAVPAIDTVPLPEANHQGIPYLSGGIGDEELEQIEARRKDFDLRLVFAEKGGAYLADVGVVVFSNNNKLLEIKSAGPIVLAKLPAGRYRIEATAEGKVQRREFTISAKRRTDLTLRW